MTTDVNSNISGNLSTNGAGVIEANVALRTGTFADLMAISNAGDGEIAVSTDQDAIIVYQGDPSVGVPYWKESVFYKAITSISFQAIPIGAGPNLVSLSSLLDTSSWLSVGTFANFPMTDLPYQTGGKTFLKVTGLLTSLAGSTPGVVADFNLQRFNTGTGWFNMTAQPISGTVDAGGVLSVPFSVIYDMTARITSGEIEDIRLTCVHSGAAALNLLGDVLMFEFIETLTS